MKSQIFKKLFALCAALIATFALAACGGGGEKSPAGKITADGSTSMEKVIGSLGEAYAARHKNVNFLYNPTGSGAGIASVKEGRADFGLSSRYLKEEEKKGGLVENIIAMDGIAIIVHKDNPVDGLSLPQLAAVFQGEIGDWAAVGGKAAPVVRIGREAASGTRDGFESATKTKNKNKYNQELTATGDVIATVKSNPNAIGYTSAAANLKDVKTLAIEGAKPDKAAILAKQYPIARPFVLVTKKDRELAPAAKSFMDFVKSEDGGKVIEKAGAIPVK